MILPNDSSDPNYGLKIQNLDISGGSGAANVSGVIKLNVVVTTGPVSFETVKLTDARFVTKENAVMMVTKSLDTYSAWVPKKTPAQPDTYFRTTRYNYHNGMGPGLFFGLKNGDESGRFYIYGPEATFNFNAQSGCNDMSVAAYDINLYQTYIQGEILYGHILKNNNFDRSSSNFPACGEYVVKGVVEPPEPVDPVQEASYDLTISPDKDFSLMCGTDAEKSSLFTINAAKAEVEGETATGYQANVTVSLTQANKFNISTQVGSGIYPDFTTNANGQLTLKVSPKSSLSVTTQSSYQLNATLVDDTSVTGTANINFVPFMYGLVGNSGADSVSVIAGQPTDMSFEVLACDATTGDRVVVTEYEDTPEISFTKPENGTGTIGYSPGVDNGVSVDDDLTVDNTGEFEVTITHPGNGFNCSGYAGCPIDGNGELENTITINSRPWGFAICQEDGSELPSTGKFMAAGESFNLQAKPLMWQTGYPTKVPSDMTGGGYCSGNVASNFLTTDEKAEVTISTVDLSYPDGGVIGDGVDSSALNTSKAPDKEGVLIPNLTWNNVGTLVVKVDSSGYGGEIDTSTATLGVLVPYQLSIKENTWTYQDSSAGFSYMGQPFEYEFQVEAQNKAGAPTSNYGLFTEKSNGIDFIAVKKNPFTNVNTDESLKDRITEISTATATWGSNPATAEGALLTQTGKISFDKEEVSAVPYATQEDGPYDDSSIALGLVVADPSLDVDFQTSTGDVIELDGMTGQAFSNQPDIRYGRMAIEGNSTSIGRDLTIPLTVEYWNGSEFITNTSDSFTSFVATNYCSDNTSSTIAFKDSDGNAVTTVENGESNTLTAYQTQPKKASARVFLRQGYTKPSGSSCSGMSSTQAWLQYNWRNLGDEDPSAHISFGATPGNRRVMSRTDKQDL